MAVKNARTKKPMIDSPHLTGLTDGDPDTDLAKSAHLESRRYDDVNRPHLVLSGARLDEVQLRRITADEVDLRNARLRDVALEQVGFPVVRASGGQWRDVEISGRLGSFEAYESEWRSVHFIGCKISYVNLRGAELHDVQFTDCVLEELDLAGAVANRVSFDSTRIGGLDVHGATLRDVDLRGATLESVDGLADLRGATLSPAQLAELAPLLAAHLGLKIEG